MNNKQGRKYARTSKKATSLAQVNDESEFSLSSIAALSILGGTFLVGLISGKLLYMCIKKT